jgi:putative transposase
MMLCIDPWNWVSSPALQGGFPSKPCPAQPEENGYHLVMLNQTYEFKLLPTPAQVETFDRWLDICKGVWNYALAERRDFARAKKSPVNACSIRQEYIIPPDAPKPTFAKQCAALAAAKPSRPWLKEPHTHVLQQVLRNLEASFVATWERGLGFPRFKKRIRSFLFPQLNKQVLSAGRISLPKIGWVKLRQSRPLPDGAIVKQVRIVKRASGFYAMLSLEQDIDIPEPQPHGNAIGVDVGINNFLATSAGELVANPRFFETGQHRLKELNRLASKKRKGSSRWRIAMHRLARQHERLSNVRKDFHFKEAHRLCDTADTIVVEALNIAGMARGNLSKQVLDAGWSQFISILQWVGLKRGVCVKKVDARGTSQQCPECGAAVPKDLSVRVHDCPECGYTADRDVAAAQVVLKRGIHSASGLGAREARGGEAP